MCFAHRTVSLLVATTTLLVASVSRGDTPASPPTTLLEQLSRETQHVYESVRGDIVRVQLPTPQWLQQINAQQQLLQKWGPQLTPEVRQQFMREQELARAEIYRRAGLVAPNSSPTPTTQASVTTTQPNEQANGAGTLQFPSRTRPTLQPANFILVATGMVVDRQGHVIVPFFVDRNSIGAITLRAVTGDGRPTTAKFIGSDQIANLTVLQIELRDDHPPALSRTLPPDGTIAVVLVPEGGAHLTIWNNTHPEPGLIVLPDSSVAGFSYNGHFLQAAAAMPIVQQIVSTGQLHRAVLGVRIREVGLDDVIRKQSPALGDRSAIYVLEVDADSAAQRGGLRPNDLILSVAATPITDKATFASTIATANGKTELQILRGNATVTLTVDLQPK